MDMEIILMMKLSLPNLQGLQGRVIDPPHVTRQKYPFTLFIVNIHYDKKRLNDPGLTNSY